MHQIDTAGAAAALPTPQAVGTVAGYFTRGNPTAGTPATIISDDWLNAVQQELVNAITGAGLTLGKTSQNQLLQAIQVLAGTGVASIANAQSPYTAVRTVKTVVVSTAGGNVVINLPAASSCTGETWYVVKTTSDTNVVNVTPNGTDPINGNNAVVAVDQQWENIGFTSIGTGWVIT